MNWSYILWEENFQSFAEDNLGRKLTDTELNRLKFAFVENDDTQWQILNMMHSAGKDAMDNSTGRWNLIDDDFKKGIKVFDNLICKEL